MSPSDDGGQRSAARLLAVQVLYQTDFTDVSLDLVIGDFLKGKIGGQALEDDIDRETETAVDLAAPDRRHFETLVRGAVARLADIDPMIDQSLSAGWTPERLEKVVRAVLRAGTFELLTMEEVPAKVIITEYVDLAQAFYEGPEIGLVNAVLDRLARTLRPSEF